MFENIFGKHIPNKIFSYKEYHDEFIKSVENADESKFDDHEKEYHNYRTLNLQRTNRIAKTYKPSQEIIDHLNNLNVKQTWIVITENWCGDSAQILPYIAKFLETTDNIEMKIILRDDNLEFADEVIKEGNPRSIPKVLGYSENGELLFIWGARPKEAQAIVDNAKDEGKSKEEFSNELHLWYARNKGKALEDEFIALLKRF